MEPEDQSRQGLLRKEGNGLILRTHVLSEAKVK